MARHKFARSFAWLALALSVAACDITPEPGLARGEALYDTCAPCHGNEAEGNRELGAPAIAGLPQWYIENQLQAFQNNWRGAHPMDTVGIRMKSMSLSLDLEGDLESVAEYVASLPTVSPEPVMERGSAQAGQQAYQTCIACHGPQGTGNEPLNSPPLVGLPDWYLVGQLQKFQKGWRGTAPQDVPGGTMRPNAMLLDEQAVYDVVAYIQTLR